MKNKKIFIPVFTLSAALLLTACSGKEAADTTKTQTTQTEAGTEAGTESGTKSGTETTGTSGTKLDDLYQQENQIFADRIAAFPMESGIAPSRTPCGQIYLQKKGSPIPIEFVASIGRRITKTTRMMYFRYRSGFSLAVENFFPGIL